MNKARLFVRVVETADGLWELRRGREVVAVVACFSRALRKANELAAALAPSAVYVHRADATITRASAFE